MRSRLWLAVLTLVSASCSLRGPSADALSGNPTPVDQAKPTSTPVSEAKHKAEKPPPRLEAPPPPPGELQNKVGTTGLLKQLGTAGGKPTHTLGDLVGRRGDAQALGGAAGVGGLGLRGEGFGGGGSGAALGGSLGRGPSGQPTGGEAYRTPVVTLPPSEEAPSTTLLQHYGVNPTIETRDERISTFAADVDTGSYTHARAYLQQQQTLPPEAAVRVEEFVNAFDYGYRAPQEEAFAVQVEAFPSPYRTGYHVLHVGVKGREVKAEARQPANLVFTLDVSGSMNDPHRLPLAKQALTVLTQQLDARDQVALVVYGSTAHVVLPLTPASQKERIIEAINRMQVEGATNVQAGLELAYELALKGFRPGAANRVILCSDGVANNGVTTADALFAKVKSRASEGITLTTVGFGMGTYNDVLMERLADQGDGHYAYVDRLDEARRIFVEQLTGTLQVIAKDVKLQLEMNPDAVERYRLLGFENRALAKEDFANDRVDAGELGAGHAVSALYEVKLKSRAPSHFATFRARFKAPRGHQSMLVEKQLPMSVVRDQPNAATPPSRLSLVAAGFAEKLRGSYWARTLSWGQLQAMWKGLPGELRETPRVRELGELISTAARLDHRQDRFEKEMPVASMDFDHVPVLR